MIAGRARFYVVAALAGAVLGELLVAALVLGIATLVGSATLARVPARVLGPVALVPLGAGVLGGAWAGVEILRRSYPRKAARHAELGRQP